MPTETARQATARFRFEVIAPLVVRPLEKGERAHLLRDLSARLWKTPDGRVIRIHLRTITRWVAHYKAHGYGGLVPEERVDKGVHRVLPEQIIERAVALRKEDTERSVRTIIRLLEWEGLTEVGRIKRTTLSEALCRAGVSRAAVSQKDTTFRLRESPYPNAMWQIDTCQILSLPGADRRQHTIHLVACLDDYSRHVVARLYPADDRPALADVLKRAIIQRGKPETLYSDNGSSYRSKMLATACGELGIAPKHTRPYRPQGRGKLERFFRTCDTQWGHEAQALIHAGRLGTLAELQEFFSAWLHSEYNARVHSATHEAPVERFRQFHPDHPILWVDPQRLKHAFLWTDTRVVTIVGTISLEGQDFEVAPELARHTVTIRYDPYDLASILVEWEGKSYGEAKPMGPLPPHSRHVRAPESDVAAATEPTERTPFHVLLERHDEQQRFAQAGHMHFAAPKDADTQ